jgi:hypothetical protein
MWLGDLFLDKCEDVNWNELVQDRIQPRLVTNFNETEYSEKLNSKHPLQATSITMHLVRVISFPIPVAPNSERIRIPIWTYVFLCRSYNCLVIYQTSPTA